MNTSGFIRRFSALLRKEVRQMLRDRSTLAVGLMLLWANDFRAVFAVAIIPAVLCVAMPPELSFADLTRSVQSDPAAALAHQRTAHAGMIIDPLTLPAADQLYKSLAVACGDRKYFSSTLGSKMSISDKVDAFPVLRNAVEF